MTEVPSYSEAVSTSRTRMHPNPDFSVSRDRARSILADLAAAPATLTRPVFIIAGYRSPLFTIRPIESSLRRSVVNQDFIHTISCPLASSLETAAAHALAVISRHSEHAEIDIIGHSLGGLVGRMLLTERGIPAVRRLFTLATPHRGAIVAPFAPIDRAARQLRPHSDFLTTLNSRPIPSATQLICYARLYDWWVGARNCAPPGHGIHWLDADTALSRLLGHFSITRDERILADCICRIHDESPLAIAATIPPRH